MESTSAILLLCMLAAILFVYKILGVRTKKGTAFAYIESLNSDRLH